MSMLGGWSVSMVTAGTAVGTKALDVQLGVGGDAGFVEEQLAEFHFVRGDGVQGILRDGCTA